MFILPLCLSLSCLLAEGKRVKISREVLEDKILGGWAGQTFGCAYGGPTEFKYNGCIIPDDITVPWKNENRCKWYFDHEPGIYDDVYMDLSFLEVIDSLGMSAPIEAFAKSFAYADYNLWHANQAARYNILNGIKAPESGYWKNNPHADDLDFQIEADFAGLVCPGMPSIAGKLCDKVGHIMCYGDGYYGGLYVATMYSLAFIESDIETIVTRALAAIPRQSDYFKCITDVIGWCRKNKNWKDTWKSVQDKWSNEISCPKGVCDPFNIDAKLNSAYIIMGLLYGAGDMGKTIEVAMRCGADSDCNPASAAGILGTILGYSGIPQKWTSKIDEVLDEKFAYTDISLRKALEMTAKIAHENIKDNGGKIHDKTVTISTDKITPAKYEKSFSGLELADKQLLQPTSLSVDRTIEFSGSAIVLTGRVNKRKGYNIEENYIAKLEINIDGKTEEILMPLSFAKRKFDIYWNYELEEGSHHLSIKWINPTPMANVVLDGSIIYDKI